MTELFITLDAVGFGLFKLFLSILWQSSILLTAVWVTAWLLRRRPASLRRGLWLSGLIIMPLLPIAAALLQMAHAPQVQVSVLPAQTITGSPKSISSIPSAVYDQSFPAEASARPASESAFSPLDYPWASGLIAYALCLACFLTWIAIGRLRIRAWLKQSRPILEDRTLNIFKIAEREVGLDRPYLLLESHQVPAPLSLGVRHAAVLMPQALPSRLSDSELKALAIHELAHIRRRDAAALHIATFVRAALFFQPLVWLAARRISTLSEQAADDAVLGASIDPVPYAKLLARLAEELPWRALSTEMAAGILFTRGAFFRRIESILSGQRAPRRLTRLAVAGAALSIIICMGIALAAPLGEKPVASGEKPAASADTTTKRVRVMTDGTNLTLDGKSTTWEELPSLLANVPDRKNTIVEFAVSSNQITLAQLDESLGKLRLITYPLEFKYLTNIGIQSTSEPKSSASESPAASTNFTAPNNIAPYGISIGFVDNTSEGRESIAGGGHGVTFRSPEKAHFVEAIEIFASRYGAPEPPDEDFHVYLMDEKYQILADIPFPYSSIKRANMKWYTLETPAVEVPVNFTVGLAFNPHQTKGIYLGIDKDVEESHSLVGLPDDGYEKWSKGGDWMVRVRMAAAPSQGREVKRLADWKAPVTEAPSSSLIPMKYDSGSSAGKQSYGGSGPAISFKVADFLPANVSSDSIKLAGISFFASRYGSGYNTTQTFFKVVVLNGPGKVIHEEKIPYGRLSYNPRWIEIQFATPLDLSPLLTGGDLIIAVDPEATQTKGIYFHYTKTAESHHSSVWTPYQSAKTVADREWMIRAMLLK